MQTDRVAGYITLVLNVEDFRTIDWRQFLEDLKRMIPLSDREYDSVHKAWRIVDCKYNEGVLNELYNKYCKQKEQGELF